MNWIGWAALIGSALGGITLLATGVVADSSTQEAAGASIAVALAVIPYCLHGTLIRMRKGDD